MAAEAAAAVAAVEESLAAAAAAATGEGPVMSLVSKKIRALRKKQKRILQMEAALAEGKVLNKEQTEVLRSKQSVEILIEEYERLRQPLSAALNDELQQQQQQQQPQQISSSSSPNSNNKELISPSNEVSSSKSSSSVEELVKLLYFATLFDVKPQSEYTATMLSRTHERSSCLTYDYVTDDDSVLLGEGDLDAIASLGTLVAARPLWSVNSHQDALQVCLHHALLWLDNSDQPIHHGSDITYAGLRGRLNKILASDFFTMTPAIKDSDDLAAAAGMYTTTYPVQSPEEAVAAGGTSQALPEAQVEGGVAQYQQKEDVPDDLQLKDVQHDQPGSQDESPTSEDLESPNQYREDGTAQHEQENMEDVEHNYREHQYREHQHFQRKQYQNQWGGRGGRRAHIYGRGRGGQGAYPNSRNQYSDSGYYSRNRNYYKSRGGRGGRSSSAAMYNSDGGGYGRGSAELHAGA